MRGYIYMTRFYDDGVTIIAIITLTIGAFAMVTKLCYKSKCSNINLCFGLINIKRQVEIETDIDIIPNSTV